MCFYKSGLITLTISAVIMLLGPIPRFKRQFPFSMRTMFMTPVKSSAGN